MRMQGSGFRGCMFSLLVHRRCEHKVWTKNKVSVIITSAPIDHIYPHSRDGLMEAVELARISLNFHSSQAAQCADISPHFLFSLPNQSLQAKSGNVKWPLREKADSRQKRLNLARLPQMIHCSLVLVKCTEWRAVYHCMIKHYDTELMEQTGEFIYLFILHSKAKQFTFF